MNTHPIPQLNPAAPRPAGRPGKYASGPVTERTLFRDGRPDRLLALGEVLLALGIARSTWDRWRRSGLTPPFVHLPNGSIRVWESDLVRWTRAQEVA
jgi:predicted DNA-binding transcriptional regulator AlpA